MTKPLLLADFMALPRTLHVSVMDGLSATIDRVAESAPDSHRFLRYQWYAAAIEAYGGHPRTIVIEHETTPLAAMPLIGIGPRWAKLAQVPGSYWPFRSFPARVDAGVDTFAVLAAELAKQARGVRIGPVHDDDDAVHALIAAMRAGGWSVVGRRLRETMRLELARLVASEAWPRASTLRKNRFHEKHLATHGTLGWHFLSGPDFPDTFDRLAEVEQRSWIARDTGGADAKFTAKGHGAFWRAAARDAALADMFHAALLTIDQRAAAFSFDIDTGARRYAIANSYDPAIGRHSPGKLLHYRNLRAAAERGVRTVDWGAGDGGYKAILGAAEGPAIRDWLMLAPGLPARTGALLAKFWRDSMQ